MFIFNTFYSSRYVNDKDPPLPTVIVSEAAESRLMETRHFRGKAAQHHGVYLLKPEGDNYMVNKKKKLKKYPETDFDLAVYQNHWIAGKDHVDHENDPKNKFPNRYLLVGRPQIGKTGVFLHLGYKLWQLAGKPHFTGPLSLRRRTVVEDDDRS